MNVSWVSNAPKSGKFGNNGRSWKKIPLQRQHIGINWPHTCLKRPYQQQKNLQLSRLLSWKTQHVTLPILISAGGHFHMLDLFQKWYRICGSCFFQFLILPGCYFHQLDLFTMSYCICGSSFFLFVTKAILIMPGKQLHSTYFLSLAATDTMWIFSLFRHHLSLKIIWKYVPPGSCADDQEEVVTIIQEVQLFSCWKSPCSTWFT